MRLIRATVATIVNARLRAALRVALGALAALAGYAACAAFAQPVAAGSATGPWLVVSDVHYDPFLGGRAPSPLSHDTNGALLDSLLAELKRTAPRAPVVIIAGDFLAHNFRRRAATSTMAYLARRFERTFPRAQFVIALGNNDSDCGDYAVGLGGPFLKAVAQAWEPLVDRHGAAPNFRADFARDGGYAAKLPIAGLRAVAFNDIYATLRYRNACGPQADAAAVAFSDLRRTLAAGAPRERTWLVTHVPPGIDAFSTAHLAHRLLVVPFLNPAGRERFDALVNTPQNRVALVIAGHTHRFAYRLSDGDLPASVPILLAPSVSPIFLNAPSFLTLDVDARGNVDNVVETSLVRGRWQRSGDFASLGASTFDAAALERVQQRLAKDPALRERFAGLYSGGGVRDIDPSNWRVYWCAATELAAGRFSACAAEGGYGIFTARAVRLAAVGGAILVVALGSVLAFARRKRGSG